MLNVEEAIDRIQRTSLNIAASTDNVIAAPAAGNKILIYKMWINAPGGVNTITFKSGTAAGGTAVAGLPPMEFVDSAGMVLPFDGIPLGVLVAGDPLGVALAAATQVTGGIYWALDR